MADQQQPVGIAMVVGQFRQRAGRGFVDAFVQALVDSEKASAVIRGIVALARSLGMTTVAEGVESESQAAELKDVGCDVIQGYLISGPLEADAFAEFMTASLMVPL